MSRGRKRKRSKNKGHIVEYKRDLSKEQEFLNQDVDVNKLGDYGDDALLKAIVYDLPSASEAEAMEIALALQKRVRGDASLLENTGDLGDVIANIRDTAREVDKAAESFDKNRESFVESIMHSAPKLSDKQKDKIRAEGMADFQKIVRSLKAGKSMKQAQFKTFLQNAPKEEILVTGNPRIKNGRNVIEPDVVTLMGFRFVLEPGARNVPQPVAIAYKKMQEVRSQQRAKMAVMSGDGSPQGWYDQSTLEAKMAGVDQEYGSN